MMFGSLIQVGVMVLTLLTMLVTLNWCYGDIPGNRPFRRSHHSAISLSHKLIIFGGLGPSACQDLWELNTGLINSFASDFQ